MQPGTYYVPTCSLKVLTYNQYGYSGYVPLYIDGQYVGTTGYTCTVTTGTHTIYVESPFTNIHGSMFSNTTITTATTTTITQQS